MYADFFYYQNAWNRPRSEDYNDVRGPRTTFNPNIGSKAKDEWERDPNFGRITAWRENLIRLYNKWDIGDRSKLPEGGIGPDKLHMYPDNIRYSANGEERRKRLQEQFPVSDLRLDHDAIAKKREEVEQTRREKAKAGGTTALPQRHQLYHATTEFTNPWRYQNRRVHTSWESTSWGPAVASKQRTKQKTIEPPRPYYAKIIVPRRVREMGTLLDHKQRRTRDNVNGGWVQGMIEHIVPEWRYDVDENGRRTETQGPEWLEKPTYVPAGTVAEVHGDNGLYTARREAYQKQAASEPLTGKPWVVDEMSEAEDEEYGDDDLPVLEPNSNVDGQEGTASDSPEDSDEESDDEYDLFTLSYRGLPMPSSPGHGGPESEDINPRGDSPKGGRPPGRNGGDDNDENDDGAPKPSRGGKKNRKPTRGGAGSAPKPRGPPKTPGSSSKGNFSGGETVEYDDKENCRWVTCTHKFPNGLEYTQRDRLPASNPDADTILNADGTGPFIEVYPKNPLIPVNNQAKYKDVKWTMHEDGVFRKKDLKWRPTMVLRKLRKDTGECVACQNPWAKFEDLITGDLPDALVDEYNKIFRQYVNRNDDEVKKGLGTHPRWTVEEFREAVRWLNELVRRNGLVWLAENWDNTVKRAQVKIDAYRDETLKLAKRGPESVRTKFSRAEGLQAKVEAARKLKKGKTSEADLKPGNYFTIEDFESEADKRAKAAAKEKETTAEKREANGKKKRKGTTKEDHRDETDDGGSGTEDPRSPKPPPNKRRK